MAAGIRQVLHSMDSNHPQARPGHQRSAVYRVRYTIPLPGEHIITCIPTLNKFTIKSSGTYSGKTLQTWNCSKAVSTKSCQCLFLNLKIIYKNNKVLPSFQNILSDQYIRNTRPLYLLGHSWSSRNFLSQTFFIQNKKRKDGKHSCNDWWMLKVCHMHADIKLFIYSIYMLKTYKKRKNKLEILVT